MHNNQDFPDFIAALEANASRFRDKVAIHFLADGEKISASATFSELHEHAIAMAATLQRRYVPGSRVILMLPSGIEYLYAFCACLYAGMIAVPLFPPQSRKPRHLSRLRNVVLDAEPSLVLGEEIQLPIIAEVIDASCTQLSTVSALLESPASAEWVRPTEGGNAVAFLQYTSGSTGTPKGVMVRHRNLLSNLELMRQAYEFDHQDSMVNWLPLYHDMGLIGGMLEPIYSGMTCYLMATQSFVKSPRLWLQALSRYRATATFAPNFAYALCNRTVDAATIEELDLSNWAHAINGAEPIHAETMNEFCTKFSAAGFKKQALSPGYGQAEATLCVSATGRNDLPVVINVIKQALHQGQIQIATTEQDTLELVACGYPQPSHQIAIVNPRTFRYCAPNEVGEIWLRGPSNADAYWRNSKASEETFHARTVDGGVAYLRSGDLGFMHEGQIVVCGRLKDLIILNGRNIYPNDLEFAISDAEPAIRTGRIAAFSIFDEASGQEKLIIVAEPHRMQAGSAKHAELYLSIRQAAQEACDCMIDTIVLVQAGSIPLTTSGKISRNEAKQQFLSGTLDAIGTDSAMPSATAPQSLTAAEVYLRIASNDDAQNSCLAYIKGRIAQVRPQSDLDVDASLIALGLDSIAIGALHASLKADFGWNASYTQLFGANTVSDLAKQLALHLTKDRESRIGSIGAGNFSAMRQSYAQRRLWYLHQLEPHSCQHNISIQIDLTGPLDAGALKESLKLLFKRHSVLHTFFRDTEHGPEQVIDKTMTFLISQCDLSSLAPDIQAHLSKQEIAKERETPFDLTAGPVMRARLLLFSESRHTLLLTFHHIAFDGRSAEIYLDELSRLYKALCNGQAFGLPIHLARYSDYAQWENENITRKFVQTELKFWSAYLHDIPQTISWPAPGATDGIAQEGSLRFLLIESQTELLSQFCREQNCTLFMGLLALYKLSVWYWSGQTSFIVGTDVAGRVHPQLNELIGFFVNQLPLRCKLKEDMSLSALFEQIADDARQALSHQELPFDLLVSGLAVQRSNEAAPLFQIKLNYQRQRSRQLNLEPVEVNNILIHQEAAGFDLILDLVHGETHIDAGLKYSSKIFTEHAAKRFIHLWARLLSEFDSLLHSSLLDIRMEMNRWDNAFLLQLQQAQTEKDRMLLGSIKRRGIAN